LQSIWSYYIYWIENKARQEIADCERISYQPQFKWYKSFLFHLFPFSIVVRSARVIKYGLRYHSEKQNSEYWWKKWVAEKQDLNLITMVESTLEAFPQLVLHLYVIRIEIVQDCPTSIFQWGKVFLSAGALSLAMAMFKDNQVLKDDDQNYEMPKTVPVIIVSFLWHSMTILVRAVVISHMFTVYPFITLGGIIIHLALIYTLIHFVWRCDYLDDYEKYLNYPKNLNPRWFWRFFAWAIKLIFELIISAMLIPTWINWFVDKNYADDAWEYEGDGRLRKCLGSPLIKHPSKRRMTIYYIIVTIENAVMLLLWYHYQVTTDSNWLPGFEYNEETITINTNFLLIIMLPSLYFLGLIFMGLYYKCLHPSKHSPSPENSNEINKNEDNIPRPPSLSSALDIH